MLMDTGHRVAPMGALANRFALLLNTGVVEQWVAQPQGARPAAEFHAMTAFPLTRTVSRAQADHVTAAGAAKRARRWLTTALRNAGALGKPTGGRTAASPE